MITEYGAKQEKKMRNWDMTWSMSRIKMKSKKSDASTVQITTCTFYQKMGEIL